MFDPQEYVRRVTEAAAFIRARFGTVPDVALTLGSGLGKLADQIEVERVIPYSDIPHFPVPTAPGHAGELLLGYLHGVPIAGLSGRKHYNEVALQPDGIMEVVFAVHVMASLGVKVYFSTNAVGGLNENYGLGHMMVVRDHIDLFMPDPIAGQHLEFGDNNYFQPQDRHYGAELRSLFKQAA